MPPDTRRHLLLHWVLDRFWPVLDGVRQPPERPHLTVDASVKDESVLRYAYQRLREELLAEADRLKTVDSKLLALGAVLPPCITIMLGLVTFLTSGRVQQFTEASVVVVAVAAFYICLQFLRALIASVQGLARRDYLDGIAQAILPKTAQSPTDYLREACETLGQQVVQHREATNDKVSELAIAHVSLTNAACGLLVAVVILGAIVLWEVGNA